MSEEAESKGKSISRVDFFKDTHIHHPDDPFIHVEAKIAHKKMKELQIIFESGEKPMSSYEIFEKIKSKRPGYIKGYGNIPKVMRKRLTIDWPRGQMAIL
ncbi:hypothetical protein ACLOJK_038382 [Asimina triloba]